MDATMCFYVVSVIKPMLLLEKSSLQLKRLSLEKKRSFMEDHSNHLISICPCQPPKKVSISENVWPRCEDQVYGSQVWPVCQDSALSLFSSMRVVSCLVSQVASFKCGCARWEERDALFWPSHTYYFQLWKGVTEDQFPVVCVKHSVVFCN